ncbi:hypothetical protein CLAIMM_05718 [Cladophialophora immunda]|nr:hypothetical protein CLAIMM_05718 [Cladophialophora immunda]
MSLSKTTTQNLSQRPPKTQIDSPTNSNAARIAITVLGAINTVIAGFLTFLKSRNQPNRALQFRNGLRGVYEDLW